jgi:hypothetical protein
MNHPVQGYNPMRWKCSERGCFNECARPKIEVFAECFPGWISMADVDGEVEINDRFLRMEWKSRPVQLSRAQSTQFGRLVRRPNCEWTIIIIAGSAKTMRVTHAMHFGEGRTWVARDLDWCKRFMAAWAKWARKQ